MSEWMAAIRRRLAAARLDPAARLWPGQDPLGRRLRYHGRESPSEPYEVIGLVADVRHLALDRDVLPESITRCRSGSTPR